MPPEADQLSAPALFAVRTRNSQLACVATRADQHPSLLCRFVAQPDVANKVIGMSCWNFDGGCPTDARLDEVNVCELGVRRVRRNR